MNQHYLKYRKQYIAYMKKYAEKYPERVKATRDKVQFGGLREKVILRDGERCVICEMTREESKAKWGRDLDVNHINGIGLMVSRQERDNRLENLETLCRVCHAKKDIQRRKDEGIFESAADRWKPQEQPRFFNRWSGQWEDRKL